MVKIRCPYCNNIINKFRIDDEGRICNFCNKHIGLRWFERIKVKISDQRLINHNFYFQKIKQTLPRRAVTFTTDFLLIFLLVDILGFSGWQYKLIVFLPLAVIMIAMDILTGYISD